MVLDNTNWSVISFEPQKSVFKILEELKLTFPQRFECYNHALGDENTSTLINVHANFSELSFINNDLNDLPLLTGSSTMTEEILILRIDELYTANKTKYETVDFIKIAKHIFRLQPDRLRLIVRQKNPLGPADFLCCSFDGHTGITQ